VTQAAAAVRAMYRCRTFRAYNDQLVNRDNVELLVDAASRAPSPAIASRGPS
jgi:hypothetical protein